MASTKAESYGRCCTNINNLIKVKPNTQYVITTNSTFKYSLGQINASRLVVTETGWKTDSTLTRKYPNDKVGRLDLKTKFKDGTICQIEMQMSDEKDTVKRILYYWSKTYSKQLKRGEFYKDLKKTIGIIITNYEVKELKEKKTKERQVQEAELKGRQSGSVEWRKQRGELK